MAEIRKREIAHKLRIGDILRGKPILSSEDGRERLNFLELGDKKIIRVNIVGNIIDKFVLEGASNFNEQTSEIGEQNRFASGVVRKKFAILTLDDASGQINTKTFGQDTALFDEINQGHTVMLIGLLRVFNNELYILPEIIKIIDPRYLLIRKLEIESSMPKEIKKEEILAVKDQIIEMIKKEEVNEGIDTERLIMEIKAFPELINQEIHKLLEEGIIYEPRPGRVRYLG